MKAITVCQPYASAIIHGPKRVENRQQPWKFRGRLLIHAGKSKKFMGTLTESELETWPTFDEDTLLFGFIIGSVEVYDCVEYYARHPILGLNPWACGRWCLLLRAPIAFKEPIPYRGELGLFDVKIPIPV